MYERIDNDQDITTTSWFEHQIMSTLDTAEPSHHIRFYLLIDPEDLKLKPFFDLWLERPTASVPENRFYKLTVPTSHSFLNDPVFSNIQEGKVKNISYSHGIGWPLSQCPYSRGVVDVGPKTTIRQLMDGALQIIREMVRSDRNDPGCGSRGNVDPMEHRVNVMILRCNLYPPHFAPAARFEMFLD
ncbi:hypothetical protein TWF281_010519 [Arthrobotrys megalospora]